LRRYCSLIALLEDLAVLVAVRDEAEPVELPATGVREIDRAIAFANRQ
jgi:hypothetical protein